MNNVQPRPKSWTWFQDNVFFYQMPSQKKTDGTVTAFTAPFNNMFTLKFKAQLTNTFFATINQCLTAPTRFQLLLSAQ